eukprot:82682_1
MSRKKWYNFAKEQSRNLLVFGYNRENYYDIIPADVSIVIASFYQALPMWDFAEEMHKFNQQTNTWFSDLFYKIGTFNALTNYSIKDKNNYSKMLKRIDSQIESSTNHIQSINNLISDMNDKNNITVTKLQNHSNSLLSIFNKISSELRDAEIYIHPDHKKIQLLQTQIKELQLSEPHIESLSLAALSVIPPFVQRELDKFHSKRIGKIRTKEQEKKLDNKDKKQRESNFNDTLSRVHLLSKNIKDKQEFIKNTLETNSQKSETDSMAFLIDVQQMCVACDQIGEYAERFYDELYNAQDYIHPSQAALIQITNALTELAIKHEETKTLLSIKNGELEAYKSQIELKEKSKPLNNLPAVQKINDILIELKNKSDSITDSVSNDEWDYVRKMIDDMEEQLVLVKDAVNPTATYVSLLEQRYGEMCRLYTMKFSEIEHQKDLLFQSEQQMKDLKEQISDLDNQLGAVMSSAVSSVETRMKAFNERGVKIQTFQKVMKLIDDTYVNVQQACQDIQESVEKDLYDIIGNSFDDKQHQDTMGMLGNVAHACDYILKAFDDIGQEMDGVAQFVHPDREMCEQLQLELIAMYENQEKQQKKDERTGGGIDLNDSENEHKDIVSSLPMRTHPNIKPGDSHDDIIIGSRRKSILDFHQAFEQEKKRLSINKDAKEDLKRNKNSRRRRSSVSNLPLGLLPPVSDNNDDSYNMNEEDKTYLKSLANINLNALCGGEGSNFIKSKENQQLYQEIENTKEYQEMYWYLMKYEDINQCVIPLNKFWCDFGIYLLMNEDKTY